MKKDNVKAKGNFLTAAKILVCTLSITWGGASFAGQGTNSGGGGDSRCLDYSNTMGKIIKTLAIIGQENIDKVNPIIKVNDLIGIKRNLKCFPVSKLDRQARSYPEDLHTELLVNDWEKLKIVEKINLTAHELSVLATYENDGEYFISEDIIKLIRESSTELGKTMNEPEKNSDKIFRAEGSVPSFVPGGTNCTGAKKEALNNAIEKCQKDGFVTCIEFKSREISSSVAVPKFDFLNLLHVYPGHCQYEVFVKGISEKP